MEPVLIVLVGGLISVPGTGHSWFLYFCKQACSTQEYYFKVNDIWLQFKNIIWPLIDQYIPKKTIKHHHKYNPKKYPTSIKKLLTRKAAIWRKVKNDKTNTVIRTKYADIANKCKIAIYNYDLEKEKKILETNNLGAFFKFANKKLSSPSGISPLMDRSGNLLTTDADKAKLLSDYFASVYTVDDGSTPPFQSRLPPDAMGINDIPISPSLIKKILGKLKTNSAAGPDNLPPIFFHCWSYWLPALHYLPFISWSSQPSKQMETSNNNSQV